MTKSNQEKCEGDYRMCEEHYTLYMETYDMLKNGLEEVSDRNGEFRERLAESSETFRSKAEAETTRDSQTIVREIKSLVASVAEASGELKEYREATLHFKTTLDETMSDFRDMFMQFGAKIADNFDRLESKLVKIEEKNEAHVTSLNKLKKMARERAERRIENCNDDFKELIVAPVAEHLEANRQSLVSLKNFSADLVDVYERTAKHFKSSLESTGESIGQNVLRLNEMSGKQGERLSEQCAKLAGEMVEFGKESNGFFDNFIANSVEHEFNVLLDNVSAATNEVKVTNQSIGVRSEETQQFCAESVNAVNIFAKAEFANVEITGETPKKKVSLLWHPEVAVNYSCLFFLSIHNLSKILVIFKKVI